MMNGGWEFSSKSELALSVFREAIKTRHKPSSPNIWHDIFNRKIEQSKQEQTDTEEKELDNKTETSEKLVAERALDVIAERELDNKTETSQKIVTEHAYDAKDEIFNNELIDETIDEMRMRSEKGDSNFRMSRIISEDDLYKLVVRVCNRVLSDDPFFEIFCSFLLECLKVKEHGRMLESVLIHAFQHNRKSVTRNIIAPALRLKNPKSVIQDFALSLNEIDSQFLLRELLNLSGFDELQDWHMIILVSLYKQATAQHTDEMLQELIVNALQLNAKSRSKDKQFGKLLLSVIQKENGSNSHNLASLERVSLLHETAFKKPSLAAINEFHNKNK